jgi:hypothetical protein
MRSQLCFAALALCLAVQSANAALVITEVGSTSGAPVGVLEGLDWWELTNTGPGAVSLDGYAWEDGNPSGDTAEFPNGISIAGGESIIVHQGTEPGVASQFRTDWGLDGSVQIVTEDLVSGSNTFSGLSSGGDEVNLYNDLSTIIAGVEFDSSTEGVTFEWATNGADLGLSVIGENGAYGASNGRIGSPGVAVPEPTTLALAGLAACGLLARRRRS